MGKVTSAVILVGLFLSLALSTVAQNQPLASGCDIGCGGEQCHPYI
jgi:hypothetical protein